MTNHHVPASVRQYHQILFKLVRETTLLQQELMQSNPILRKLRPCGTSMARRIDLRNNYKICTCY